MGIIVRRYGSLAEWSARRNGEDLELTVRWTPEVTEDEIRDFARLAAKRLGSRDLGESQIIDYDQGYMVIADPIRSAHSVCIQDGPVASPREVQETEAHTQALDLGGRLVDRFRLSPSGASLAFLSTLKVGRAIRNLYMLHLDSGKHIRLTEKAGCSAVDLSVDNATVVYLTHYPEDNVMCLLREDQRFMLCGNSLGLTFKGVTIGDRSIFVWSEPHRHRIWKASQLIEHRSLLYYAPEERALLDHSLPYAAVVGRGTGVCASIASENTVLLFDLAAREQTKAAFEGAAKIIGLKVVDRDHIAVAQHQRQGVVLQYCAWRTGQVEAWKVPLPENEVITDWSVHGDPVRMVYATRARRRRGFGRSLHHLDLSQGTCQKLRSGGYYSRPQIARNGTVAWLELKSNRAIYGQIMTATM